MSGKEKKPRAPARLAPPASRCPFHVVIPARYASTRLPGKVLLDIGGKPMVVRVAERAQASGALSVIVATDHEDVAEAAREHGIDVCMTDAAHASGTDRIAQVVRERGFDRDSIVVNVQGDEPLIAPALIAQVAQELQGHEAASIATLAHPIHDFRSYVNPNYVKVVMDHAGYALYFSRAMIPYARDWLAEPPMPGARLPEGLPVLRHIGIYAYRVSFLQQYTNLIAAPIERLESLEQLRALWHGYRIAVAVTDDAPAAGVDTPEDLVLVRRQFDRATESR